MFLNTDYEGYLLADSNPDLIALYQRLAGEGREFIDYCRSYFKPSSNNAVRYYRLREEFNTTADGRRKSALFLYLNRHCYNGLVRYNSHGRFNTPFGRHARPYFPEKEMLAFLQAAGRAVFLHAGFELCMDEAREGDVIYCDPPYAPLSATACFTDYHTGGFHWQDQLRLVQLSAALAERGVQVVVSNHDTPPLRKVYRAAGARISRFEVRRTISADTSNRAMVGEMIAVFC